MPCTMVDEHQTFCEIYRRHVRGSFKMDMADISETPSRIYQITRRRLPQYSNISIKKGFDIRHCKERIQLP
jgi:hypothetical protein